jgi:predicted nucleotidyltransferase component of viral defense system
MIETLQDNVASKMTALVERGAPRDLRDIYELCSRGFVSVKACWSLYSLKNPGQTSAAGAAKVLFAVERLELQRPLDTISDIALRDQAARLRSWYREVFCHPGGG